MASSKIKRNRWFVLRCCQKNPSRVKKHLEKATDDEIETLAEIAHNVYKGNVSVPHDTVQRLRPYKKQLQELGSKRTTKKGKRKVLQKGGGFFIPILASIATSLFNQLLNG